MVDHIFPNENTVIFGYTVYITTITFMFKQTHLMESLESSGEQKGPVQIIQAIAHFCAKGTGVSAAVRRTFRMSRRKRSES